MIAIGFNDHSAGDVSVVVVVVVEVNCGGVEVFRDAFEERRERFVVVGVGGVGVSRVGFAEHSGEDVRVVVGFFVVFVDDECGVDVGGFRRRFPVPAIAGREIHYSGLCV